VADHHVKARLSSKAKPQEWPHEGPKGSRVLGSRAAKFGASILLRQDCSTRGGEVWLTGVFLEIRRGLSSRLRRFSLSPITRPRQWWSDPDTGIEIAGDPCGPRAAAVAAASGFPRLAGFRVPPVRPSGPGRLEVGAVLAPQGIAAWSTSGQQRPGGGDGSRAGAGCTALCEGVAGLRFPAGGNSPVSTVATDPAAG